MSSSPMPDQVNSQQSPVARPELQSESDRLKLLLYLTNALVSNLEPGEVLRGISASIRQVMYCDVVGVWVPCREQGQLRQLARDFQERKGFLREDRQLPIEGSGLVSGFNTYC